MSVSVVEKGETVFDSFSEVMFADFVLLDLRLNLGTLSRGLVQERVTSNVASPGGLPRKDVLMPKPFPKEFRDDVIRVAENRDPDVTLAQIAKDFGVHVGTLDKWMRQARIEAGEQPGETKQESAELRELRKRNRLLEQEVEVLRRATAYLSQAHLPGK